MTPGFSKGLLYLGLLTLVGGVFARQVLLNPVKGRWLLTGWLMLLSGAALAVWWPLQAVGYTEPRYVWEYLITIAAGQAVVVMLLGGVILLILELNAWPGVALLGASLMTLWGLAGIGHGGEEHHAAWVRLAHVLHAGAMVVWLAGVLSLLRGPDRAALIPRFQPYASAAVALIALTGVLLVLQHAGWPLRWEVAYVQVLLYKLGLALLALLCAAWLRFKRFSSGLLLVEALLLLGVLLLTARLSTLPMPA